MPRTSHAFTLAGLLTAKAERKITGLIWLSVEGLPQSAKDRGGFFVCLFPFWLLVF
jgi:hypothetical protein